MTGKNRLESIARRLRINTDHKIVRLRRRFTAPDVPLQLVAPLHNAVRQAAGLCENPEPIMKLADQWAQGIRKPNPKNFGVFRLISEDIVGILLVAHRLEPDRFGPDLAADAASIASAITGHPLKPARIAANRRSPDRHDYPPFPIT